jgi:tetratricopeptide (TPR) repeat protein
MNKFKRIYALMRADKYTEALREIEKLEKASILYPKILVLKGICIFCSDKLNKYTYEDVILFYKKALLIDDEYVEALIELGHHYYSSENKSIKAIPLFRKSLKILKNQVTDSILGYAKCIEEVESSKEAIRYLKNIKTSFLDAKKIDDLIKEYSDK